MEIKLVTHKSLQTHSTRIHTIARLNAKEQGLSRERVCKTQHSTAQIKAFTSLGRTGLATPYLLFMSPEVLADSIPTVVPTWGLCSL